MNSNQLLLFIIFLIDGFIIGFVFDFFRIWRKSFSVNDITTYIQDSVMCMIIGFILLYSTFKFNNGEIRVFLFISLILGFVIYMFLISKFFVKLNVSIIIFFKKIVKKIFKNIIKIPKK